MAGIYIHIPFCEQFCTYCSFYSVKGRTYRGKFIKALKKEIELKKDFLRGASTIYFGGGTPSILSIQQLQELLLPLIAESIVERDLREVTIEVNPNDISLEYAQGLVEIGFNRVSMGVQSFIDEHLVWMNRRHKAAEAVNAYNLLKTAGIKNISLDLIFGYSSLTTEQWRYNLYKIIELAPQHISAYQMSVEPGSALSVKLRKGDYTLPNDSVCAEQYKILQQMLSSAGYEQYEISNFALKGFCSRHNSSYWDKTPYYGLGPSAHSFNGTKRFWNTDSVKKYCDYYLSPCESAPVQVCNGEILSDVDMFNESIMLGLRTVAGVNTRCLNSAMFNSIAPIISREKLSGNLILEGHFLKIPLNKLFISDSIIRDLFIG
ncbi:MAG: radical SAM family heme chaperone HemW [Bacteroidales bacterium]